MSKVSLLSATCSCENLITVNFVEGVAKAPYDKDAAFIPNANLGYDVFVDYKDFKWYQKAARVLASLDAYRCNLTSCHKLDKDALYWLCMALYDGKHEIVVQSTLSDKELSEIENILNIQCFYRDLADSDSKTSTPVSLVNTLYDRLKKAGKDYAIKVSLKCYKRGDRGFSDLKGLNAVGLASYNSPCLGIIDLVPHNVDETSPIAVALVGKGITFDSGGYSLKPEKFMATMRTDKTAVVYLCAAAEVAMSLGFKKHIRLYLCCAENMVSGQGMLPGDIIKYSNDVSVEVNNTDAEGRLVLADGLLNAVRDDAEFILDMATLTGAAKVAVGRDMFSVLARSNVDLSRLKSAFDRSGEMYWQLPLESYHKRFLSSRRATITNSGHGDGAPGASVAASFLGYFVPEDKDWVHIDLSSAYLVEESPFLGAGPTGSTILGLARFLCS